MEKKLKQANENIEYLVNALISEKTRNYDGCCLRITLLGEDRMDDCNNQSCYQCNYKSKMRYREMLLKHYIVK
jgi:hypothetical protein